MAHAARWRPDLQTVLTILCGITLVLQFVPGWSVLGYASVVFGSYFALRSAYESIVERTLDVNLLMVLAAIGAIVVGHVPDAAALLFLFSLSSTLEAMALGKTRSAIEGLVKLRPDRAIRIGADGDQEVPSQDLDVGDLVRVLPYQQVPADGTLAQNWVHLDESAMTGESRPVEKLEGERVLAGTQNLDRMMVMTVTARTGDSTLERIVELVSEAQENKASGERISAWFGQRYTVFVFAVFILAFAVRMTLGNPLPDALYSALILLVALSPCALVISTPASTLSALAFAGRRGILVRGGQYMEEAGRVNVVALDKTGTLTEGRPQLVEVCVGEGWREPERLAACPVPASASSTAVCDRSCAVCAFITCWHAGQPMPSNTAAVLSRAAAAEAFSTHPIAEAIVRAAREAGLPIPEADSHTAVAGMGIESVVDGHSLRIGQLRFFEGGETFLPGGFREHVQEMQARGLTAVLMNDGQQWTAFGLHDVPRPSAAGFVQNLKAQGARVVMLTGDNPATAHAVAKDLGVDEVHAGLMPQDKAALIGQWVDEGQRVMMVGDGINDAPALARAHVGVAMGGLGSDVALRAADVVLVQDRIERIPVLMDLGRRTNRTIKANLLFAAGMIIVLTLLSFVWPLVPALVAWTPQMPLPMAVVGHEGSTVLVILNGLRLLRAPKGVPVASLTLTPKTR